MTRWKVGDRCWVKELGRWKRAIISDKWERYGMVKIGQHFWMGPFYLLSRTHPTRRA